MRTRTPSAKLRVAAARRPKHADTAFAFVLSYTAGGKTVRLHYELVALRRGRIVCELIATAPFQPSLALVQRATTVLSARAASG